MERLSDFKPLAKVTLPDVGDIPCSGLTLIVGPNSSGKSQFLRDLYQRLCGERRTLVVALDVQVNKPTDYPSFIKCLEFEGYLETYVDDGNVSHLRPRTTYSGSGRAVPVIQSVQAQNFYQSYDGEQQVNQPLHGFLNHFGRLLVTALFLDRRLDIVNTTGLIRFNEQPPGNDLHVLHINDDARQKLSLEISQTFGRAVWTDMSAGNILCLKVNEGELASE
jgi:hypothetical protein